MFILYYKFDETIYIAANISYSYIQIKLISYYTYLTNIVLWEIRIFLSSPLRLRVMEVSPHNALHLRVIHYNNGITIYKHEYSARHRADLSAATALERV